MRRLLVLLCLVGITQAGPKPIDDTDVRPVCTELDLLQVQYIDGSLHGTVQWATDKVCIIRIVLVAAPVYYNADFDPTTVVGSEAFVGSVTQYDHQGVDPVSGPATIYPDLDPGYVFIGWDCRVYAIRDNDNTVMGWSEPYLVSRY